MTTSRSRLSLCLFPWLLVPLHGQTITFSDNIAPIIYNNCTKCHRTGQVAPFTLASYDDVKKHAPTIAAVTQSRYMPPWKANAGWAPFRDERRLSTDQIAMIQQWVAAGMPEGDPAKTPAVPVFPDGWQLGAPDLILEMPTAFQVPADGPDVYRNFVLRTGLTEDRWIRAIELKPSARAAVHHVLFFSDTTGDGRKKDGQDGSAGFPGFGSVFTLGLSDPLAALANPALLVNALAGGLGGWVPGTTPAFLPEGIAYALPKGADLILQTHFHPDGRAEAEKTQVAIYFGQKPPRQITQVQAPAFFGVRAGIDIPAGKTNYMVRGSFTLPVDVDAFSISAHTHYLGRGSRLTATLPSGEVRVLLSITDWDFNWQDTYIFKDLVSLPAKTRIDGELIYDNSAGNSKNPFSPARRVQWGENSTDEMGSLILNVVPRTPTDISTLQTAIIASVLVAPPAVGNKPQFIGAGVVDGASALPDAVSPGKIVVLYGDRLGPATLTSSVISASGKLSANVGNTQVLFDGAAAPLLYSSAGQVAAIVPYALEGKTGTQVRVQNGANLSDAVALPVTPAGPSIFTADLSGSGQGVILNQDVITVNSAAKPAEKGSIVVIYATGEGQTSPGGMDGQLANGPAYPQPVQSVQVKIGGIPAEVLYAGAAPSLVAGVMQLNVRIPADAPSGNTPVEISVGTAHSQPGVTVAVR